VHSPVCIFNYVFRQASFLIFTNKVSGHFQKSSCPGTANSSGVAATREKESVNWKKAGLLWGVYPKAEIIVELTGSNSL
jgi:hypothetical protein